MTPVRRGRVPSTESSREIAGLRARLAESEETLRAIRTGEVDAVVVDGRRGPQVFTLEGAEHPYRVLIESMNEGALILDPDKTILYANRCFAQMVASPLETLIGTSLRRFLTDADRAALRPVVRRGGDEGAKIQVELHAADGARRPVQVSVRRLAETGAGVARTGLVVTDMSEARRTERSLRALTRRVIEVQEDERGRVALELHDHIAQLLCAVILRSQALSNSLARSDSPAKTEAAKLHELLAQAAEEVERISRGLRPGVLEFLGLVAVLRATTREFAGRTGVRATFACPGAVGRQPADSELAMFRIVQEALENVERHAGAANVRVALSVDEQSIRLSIADDGSGFDTERLRDPAAATKAVGLLSIRERAAYVGGTVEIRSAPGAGTTLSVRIPLGPVRSETPNPGGSRARRPVRRRSGRSARS